MCSRAYTNPVNGRHYKDLDEKPYWEISKRINNELSAQDDNRRLYRRLPSVQEQMRLLALYMEALEFWQRHDPLDYCLDNRSGMFGIEGYIERYRCKIAKLAGEMGLKVELQVIVEQLPMVAASLKQQLQKVRA